MKKFFALIGIILFGLCFLFFTTNNSNVNALNFFDSDNYVIYSLDGVYLFEKQGACVGDEFIDSELNCYVIVELDDNTKTGKAKFVKKYSLPRVKQKQDAINASNSGYRGTVGLYLTHNDESYITGDGVDSVYGPGGVHDVAKLLAMSLKAKNVNALLDETLHIPHDTSAYSRSNSTAKKLLSSGVDAIFDIHRDATSRAYYVTKVNGEDFCRVRMVVGKANPNYEQNKAFALFLMSVAQTYCPNLFVDIYMAKGHYNQGLSPYAMLFEFGSHLVEKSLVLKTVPYLADVLNIALYGELVIDDTENKQSGENKSNLEQSGEGEQNTMPEQPSEQIEQGENNKQEQQQEDFLIELPELNESQNSINSSSQNDGAFITVNQNTATSTNGYLSIIMIALVIVILVGIARKKSKNKH